MAANGDAPPAEPSGRQDFMVVGIGASAGGLEAATALVKAIPASSGIAFVLVQHLDPTHESMMADLLANQTSLPVRQAVDGMPLRPDHIYLIPPGAYLSVADEALRVSERDPRHGARLPFDLLLDSLAQEFGRRAACVVLSGTGADGSRGLKSVKEHGGLVVAQEPDEAGHDGMPRSAILTGAVDLVLGAAAIPDALIRFDRRTPRISDDAAPGHGQKDWFPEILDLVRAKAGHDFSLYKQGTMRRRVERRRALAAVEVGDMARYVALVRRDPEELGLLVKDLLINVTSFFRDPQAFDRLADTILPELIKERPANQPIRVWVAGCSTGEEAYSLAMLFRERLAAATRDIKLQIFASDADEDAIRTAREGFYPFSIETDVSPERLDRFFVKEERGYRARPELRGDVVFTVQDVLADPPFSRLDLMSCRNLLIYFGQEAQAKLVALCHFALRDGGVLMLGRAESAGDVAGRFEPISKSQRLFRRIGRSRPGEFGFSANPEDAPHLAARPGPRPPTTRHTALAELCRRLVLENYGPAAAVLVDAKHERLYALGSSERYLRVAPGYPSHDLLAMAPHGLRVRLRSAIQQAAREGARVTAPGGRIERDGREVAFAIAVHPVQNAGEKLFLVCFIDQPPTEARDDETGAARADHSRVSELERELDATKLELQAAIRDLEASTEEQKTINEEALSVNEEFQSTNEELLTSKEELQSLNEELTALNSQLQETLERQRVTANDLQNVLYSTDVATLFLDRDLNIRFFTPATRRLFSVIPGDVGRPLADLHALSADQTLPTEARSVLESEDPVEREIEAHDGAWYVRRILPYRSQKGAVEGVVITFADVTERRRAGQALATAKREADAANAAKSRFLAAASHDLRQPLQALTLLQGMLAKAVTGEKATGLVERFGDMVGAMSGMLNSLLDVNEIEAGAIQAHVTSFRVGDMLDALKTEFSYQAEAKGLKLRVLGCAFTIESDRRLLEQMIRNLLTNALKYTAKGGVLLGCRPRGAFLQIEIWDSGIGLPEAELSAIFDEYHQVDNPARQRSRGLGLGLSIVKRLGDLLGHRIDVRSRPGKGSVFTIEVNRAAGVLEAPSQRPSRGSKQAANDRAGGTILIVEDDPDVRNLLQMLVESEGYRAVVAADGAEALDASKNAAPDLILADYNLPGGMSGVDVVSAIRKRGRSQVPAVILTGDISTEVAGAIARSDSVKMSKPVKPSELAEAVRRLLADDASRSDPEPRGPGASSAGLTIYVVDDDADVGDAMRAVLEGEGWSVEVHPTAEAFLASYDPSRRGCVLIDAYLPGMDGFDLLRRVNASDDALPAIMITGDSDVPMAVRAMKSGALDFIEKPVGRDDLVESVVRALEMDPARRPARREQAERKLSSLTSRQREILGFILAGHPNKNIAADLRLSQRTVENHRAAIMAKTGTKSLPALARLAFTAGWGEDPS